MNRPLRTAAILTLSFTFIALWIAFVTTGDEPLRSDWPLHWLLSVATTLFLMGTLFLTGLVMASTQEASGWAGSDKSPLVLRWQSRPWSPSGHC